MDPLRVVGADDLPDPIHDWTRDPIPARRSDRLSDSAYRVLSALIDLCGRQGRSTTATDRRIGAECGGKARAPIQKALAQLEAAGWIERTHPDPERPDARVIHLRFGLTGPRGGESKSAHPVSNSTQGGVSNSTQGRPEFETGAPRNRDTPVSNSGRSFRGKERERNPRGPTPAPAPGGAAGPAGRGGQRAEPGPPTPADLLSPADLDDARRIVATPGAGPLAVAVASLSLLRHDQAVAAGLAPDAPTPETEDPERVAAALEQLKAKLPALGSPGESRGSRRARPPADPVKLRRVEAELAARAAARSESFRLASGQPRKGTDPAPPPPGWAGQAKPEPAELAHWRAELALAAPGTPWHDHASTRVREMEKALWGREGFAGPGETPGPGRSAKIPPGPAGVPDSPDSTTPEPLNQGETTPMKHNAQHKTDI